MNSLFFAMAKIKDSEDYLFATELWHKRILEYDVKPTTWFANHIPFTKRKKNQSVGTIRIYFLSPQYAN